MLTKNLGSELMMYDSHRDEVHVLNATASMVLTLLREGQSVDGIEREIRRRFYVQDGHDVAGELRQCLEELQCKGLLPADREPDGTGYTR